MLKNREAVEAENIKICDFGLATRVDVKEYLFKRCGTPGYVAPEIVKADANNPNFRSTSKCDVFSAGVILHLLLSKIIMTLAGDTPFNGENYRQILKATSECKINYNDPQLLNKSKGSRFILLSGVVLERTSGCQS